jgi:hypothetical protein
MRANVVQKYKKSKKIKSTLILHVFFFSISIKVKGISYITFNRYFVPMLISATGRLRSDLSAEKYSAP